LRKTGKGREERKNLPDRDCIPPKKGEKGEDLRKRKEGGGSRCLKKKEENLTHLPPKKGGKKKMVGCFVAPGGKKKKESDCDKIKKKGAGKTPTLSKLEKEKRRAFNTSEKEEGDSRCVIKKGEKKGNRNGREADRGRCKKKKKKRGN